VKERETKTNEKKSMTQCDGSSDKNQ